MANKKITELMAGTPTRDSLLESAIDYSGTMDSRKAKAGAIADLNNIIVAEEYDDTRTYVYGEYRINEGVLYRCTTPINVAEAWTSAHWTAVMVTGEYKRVRIMTKAQFDLLSNDEKDGFIYVSDYPTKIQDIDNVSLTTSDNNKLLGSFVENGEVVVRAVGIETITLTPQTGINVSGSVSCKKFGNIAVVSIQNVTFANTGVNQLLIKGAPKALETVYSSKPAGSNLNNTNNIAPNIAYVDNNGYIYFNIHASNTTQHWISLVYPCEQ